MADPAQAVRPPSLRRRLLLFLLVPMAALLLIDAVVTYGVALGYSNRVHDSDLSDDVRTLAQMFRSQKLSGDLPEEARFLLEYDPDDHNYYTVSSSLRGRLSGNGHFAEPPPPPPGAAPRLFDTQTQGRHLRAASMSLVSPRDPGEILTVTIAETLRDRHQRAREILFLTVPLQTLLILSVLSLVWFGVNYGLRILQPLTRRLAAREHELGPISGSDVPVEILPLTRTIDALFARLRAVLALQERFIADAAHQLRTPLAGLRLHVERAMADPRPETVDDALRHVHALSQRTARTATQLLALTRAQSPWREPQDNALVDLAGLIPDAVGMRVHEALRSGVDLGYQGPDRALPVLGDAGSLHELLDNLIDNAMRYGGPGVRITVSLQVDDEGEPLLRVEDNGPGVAPDALTRLGERFFRVPGAREGGTGLGLAIVKQIASQHRARVTLENGDPGLCVTVRFPATPKSS